MLVGEIRRQMLLCESCEEYFITTVLQFVSCHVIKAWIFHQADYPLENVPTYICAVRT